MAKRAKYSAAQKRALGLADPLERDFNLQFINYARLMGYIVAHFRSVPVRRKDGSVFWQTPVQADGAGFPDNLCIRVRVHCPKILVAELKVGDNITSPAQREWLKAFESVGIPAYTFSPNDWPEIQEVLR